MTVIHYGNQYYKGLSSDTKPVAASTAVNAIFLETDTGNEYSNDGAAWNIIRSGNVTTPYTWMVYKASSTLYKAKSGITGLTPYSGTNLKTDIIDNIKFNPANGNHIHFLNADTPYDWPSNAGTSIDTGGHDYTISGESMWGVLIRPLGNTQVVSCSNRFRQTFENFTIYIDSGASYTGDAMRITASAAGTHTIHLRNLRMQHWDGGTRHQAGRPIVLLMAGADPNISWVNIDNVIIDGFDSALMVTTSAPTGFCWCNEIHVNRLVSFHSKYFVRTNIPLVGSNMAYGWYFKNCAWQTTGVDATTESMFDIDVTNIIHRGWDIDNCIMWDPINTNKKFLKANTNCHVLIKGGFTNGDAYMGGSGWDATNLKWNAGAQVQRISPMMEKYGATSVADGGTITHGVVDHSNTGVIPKVIVVTGRIAGQIITVTARTATTFTVAIKTDAGAAGTTQIVDWYARGGV